MTTGDREESLPGYEERFRELHARIRALEEDGERTSREVERALDEAMEKVRAARLGSS